MEEAQKKPTINVDRYVDPTGEYTTKQLRLSEWYVRNRQLLGQIGTGALILFAVGFNLYGLFAWGNYLVFGITEDLAMEQQVVGTFQNYNRTKPLYQAQALEIQEIDVFVPANNRFDFVANVTNPNQRYTAEVTYKYTFDGGETDEALVKLLPGENRPLSIIGFDREEGFPTNVRFELVYIRWNRISPHYVFNPVSYVAERLNFSLEKVSFTASSVADNIPSNKITFDVSNNSVYGYKYIDLYIELKNGTQTVGIMKTVLEEFGPGETHSVDIRNTTQGLSVGSINIYPVVDVFDKTQFLPARALEVVPGFKKPESIIETPSSDSIEVTPITDL